MLVLRLSRLATQRRRPIRELGILPREYLTILSQSFLTELLEGAGFTEITPRGPITDTGLPDFFADALMQEHEIDHERPHTLLLKAVKPRRPDNAAST